MKKYFNKTLSFILVLTLVLGLFSGLSFNSSAADLPSSGSCGTNVTYTFDSSTSTLTITGTGAMWNYSYSYSSTSGVSCNSPFYKQSNIKTVVIENGVKGVGDHAFRECNLLTNVTIPDSVTSIGERAFYYCISLSSITIPDSVTSIGEGAFAGCSGLTSIIIPDSVTSISSYAFSGCSGLTSVTIGNSVKSIGNYAFSGCSSLTSITIPDSVTYIGFGAFYYCSGLTGITIPNSVTSIGEEAFYGCSGLTKVNITDLSSWCKISFRNYIANPLSYAHNLYLNNVLITDLVIPNSVTSIGNYAFVDCSGLTSVTIPNSVTSIGNYAFEDCSGLTSVTIGNSVKSIGNYAFQKCSGLTSIIIPDSVTSIGHEAFYGCSGLTSVIYRSTQEKWNTIFIGSYNDGLTNAQKLYCPSGKQGSCGNNVTYSYTYANNIGVLTISGTGKMTDYASASASPFYSLCVDYLIIKNGVAGIGNYSFYGSAAIKSITIPDSVTSIGSYAFRGCSGLTSITIPDSVTSIGDSAFRSCSSLATIDVKGNNCSIYDSGYTIPANTTIIINGSTNVYNYVLKYNRNFICNHIEESDEAKEPTCTDVGLTAGTHCKVCGTVLVEQEISAPSLGHTPAEAVRENEVAPTCTKTGSYYEVVYCSVCGEQISREKKTISKLPHTPAEAVRENEIAPTCTKSGSYDEAVYCSVCEAEISRETKSIEKIDHNYTSVVTEATCTHGGYTTYTCKDCRYSYIDDFVDVLDHTLAEAVIENEAHATCTKAGYYDEVVYCSVCEAEISRETKTIDALGHYYEPVVTAPKANAVGYTQYKCSRCLDLKKDEAGNIIKDNFKAPTGKPAGFKCTARTAAAMKFTWTKTAGVSGYQIQISNAKGTAWATSKALTANSYTFSKLTAGSGYKARVRFFIKAADGKNYFGAWTTINSPTLPKATKVTSATAAKKAFTAKWGKVAGVTGYQLQYATNAKFTKATTKTIKGAAKYSLKVANLKGGTKYFVRVRTYKTIGGKNYYSAWSPAKAVTTKR